MSAELQRDLDAIQKGLLKAMALIKLEETKEGRVASEKFIKDEVPVLVSAGFRVLATFFINIERLANAQEERLNRDGR